jgi:hypothetical protein
VLEYFMVQKHSVYRKSAHAADALSRRDQALTLRLRSLLILVDGRRPVEELARLSPAGPETGQLLSQLEQLGMIEPAAARSVAAAPQAPVSPPAVGATAANTSSIRTVPLAEAQRAAVRRLNDLLGPQADGLCMRIESVRTAQELLAILQRAESVVRSARGAEAATSFMQHMVANRPA